LKKSLFSLLLAVTVALSGCASLLEQEYVHVTPHNVAPTTEGDPSTLRAENYQELVNALMYLVTQGAESGRIRLYADSEDIGAELEAACLEVVQESPLGAYSVEYIKYDVAPVVTYSEAEVQITYRRSREQVTSIVSATGITAIRSELRSALTSFDPEQVLRIGYFDENENFISSLIRQAYHSVPAAALDYPDITVAVYPDSGPQRIVEIGLTYHLDQEELLRRQTVLETRLQDLSAPLQEETGDERISAALALVLDTCRYSPEAGATAYHAFLDGVANSEGIALSAAALCASLDIPCLVAEGVLLDEPHCWNLVQTEQGWLHVDLTSDPDAKEPVFSTSEEMELVGYIWDKDTLLQLASSTLS